MANRKAARVNSLVSYFPGLGEQLRSLTGRFVDGLDPEISEVVIKLNANGFITAGSCAGHRDCPPGHGNRGFISFETCYSHAAIIAVLTWYGLKNITVDDTHDDGEGAWNSAIFDPVGKRISAWWISQAEVIAKRKGLNSEWCKEWFGRLLAETEAELTAGTYVPAVGK